MSGNDSTSPNASVAYRSALQAALTYSLVAALWILLSDLVVLWLFPDDPRIAARFSILKGWGFVVVTGMLLYAILWRHATRMLRADQQYREGLALAEQQKRSFFQNTIAAITEGKLLVRDPEDLGLNLPEAAQEVTITHPREVHFARDAVREVTTRMNFPADRVIDLLHAVGEAVTNAVKHANGGVVTVHPGQDCLWVRVADKGSGIGDLMLPRMVLERGYSTKPSLGMGYTLMLALADRVYLTTGPEGTTVILEMCIHPPAPRANIEPPGPGEEGGPPPEQ